MIYDLGDGVNLRHTVRDAAGELVDATVALIVTRPDGTTITPTIAHTGLGTYDAATFEVDQVDDWRYRWTVSGPVTDVAHGQFSVANPAPLLYVSLARVKSALGKLTDDDRDELVELAIRSACRRIERRTGGRRFWRDPVPTTRIIRTAGRIVGDLLLVDDLVAGDDLVVESGSGVTWTAVAGVEPDPPAPGWPVTALRATTWVGVDLLRITTRWGWPAVPDDIEQAALILSLRHYRRKDSPQGVMGSADWGAVRVSKLDPDVEDLVFPYCYPGFA